MEMSVRLWDRGLELNEMIGSDNVVVNYRYDLIEFSHNQC